MYVRLSTASEPDSPMVVVTFDDPDELHRLVVDLDSAQVSLNHVPGIDALRAGLSSVVEDPRL